MAPPGARAVKARAGVIIALVLTLSAGPVAAWSQAHGDAQRSGFAVVRDEALDVVRVWDLLPPDESLKTVVGPSLVDTPHGLIGVARRADEAGTCILLQIRDPAAAEATRIPLPGCRHGYFQGYDPLSDTFYLCSIEPAAGAVFQARFASNGTLRAVIRPLDLPGVVPDPETRWSCSGIALDLHARIAIVPFQSSRTGADFPRNRIVKLHLDTWRREWAHQVDVGTGYFSALPSDLQRNRDQDGLGANFLPLIATLTSEGVIVVGASICPDVPVCDPPRGDITKYSSPFPVELAAAWFDLRGSFQGVLLAREDTGANPRRSCLAPADARLERVRTGSLGAVALGAEAVLHLGQCLYKLRTSEPEPVTKVQVPSLEYREGGDLGMPPGSWGPNALVMPIRKAVAAFHPVELTQEWSWTMDDPGVAPQVILAGPGNTYWVLASAPARREGLEPLSHSFLYRLDASAASETKTALLVQKLQVPVRSHRATEDAVAVTPSRLETPVRNFSRFVSYFNRGPEITPTRSGDLVVSDLSGRIVVIGLCPGLRRPILDLPASYAEPNRPFELRIRPPEGVEVRSLTVIWGDGEARRLDPRGDAPISASHTYSRPGQVEVLVTAAYADNTTGSTVLPLTVGAAPLPLTALQVAFAPENQNLTFFLLGLLVTLLGAVWALARRLHRRSRIESHLERLDGIREAAASDLVGALKDLDGLRERFRAELARGRLDDGQFAVLHSTAYQLQRALRRRLFAPFEGRMSRHFHRQLEAALEDGVVNADEATSLRQSLRRERSLSEPERRRIARLLEA